MKIVDDSLCTACGACENICPYDAVRLTANNKGVLGYNIDEAKCVSCKLCSQVCPGINSLELSAPRECFAAYCVVEDLKIGSSSGGVVSALAQYYFENGGEVIAAGYRDKCVQFGIYVDFEQWKLAKGSYYVKAYTNKIYQEVSKQISQGINVLFIGLPCQVAGLRNYLTIKKFGKHLEKLVTVDLICHGAPPQMFLTQHIDYICKKQKLVYPDKISFRDGLFYRLKLEEQGITIYEKPDDEDAYFSAFLQGAIFSESCYSCKYARLERVGDLTVGDFWGLKGNDLETPTDSPISLILVNSQMGERIIKLVNNLLYLEKRDINEAVLHNKQLTCPVRKHPDQTIFVRKYKKYNDFDKSIRLTRIPLFILISKVKKKIKACVIRRK